MRSNRSQIKSSGFFVNYFAILLLNLLPSLLPNKKPKVNYNNDINIIKLRDDYSGKIQTINTFK